MSVPMKEIVKTVRSDTGLTQADFGKRLGWHQVKVSKIELGIRELKATELVEIARLFHLSIDALVGGIAVDASAMRLRETIAQIHALTTQVANS